MTIKELEQKTGMTRANIRYYEGEGLLNPKRLDNGYRDYSEEDARTLEKIRLLRQVGLDIDTIRKVQRGLLPLEQALFVQQTKLEGDKALMERAAEVCRELGASGVEYAALEPRPYLARLETPQASKPGLTPPAPPQRSVDDTPKACYHPWQRFFARSLDMALYDTVFNILWLVLFRDQSLIRLHTNTFAQWFFALLSLAFTLALEPLWLHFWGWTPGKWLFGLKLRDKDGGKLSLAQGRLRSWQLMGEGYGWNLPIYSVYRVWKGRQDALEGWDGSWNSGCACRYTKEERRFGIPVFVAAWIILPGLLLLALLWSALPPCRGDLTVADFARNYNHCKRVAEYGEETGSPTLDDRGQWAEREPSPGTATVYIFGDTTVYEKPKYAFTAGYVTEVTLRMSSRDTAVGGCSRETQTLLSLCRSAGTLNLFNILPAQRDAAALMDRWEDFDQDFLGVHVSQRVETVGYERTTAFGALLWCEDEDAPHHCEKTVTFTIPDSDGRFAPPPGQGRADG